MSKSKRQVPKKNEVSLVRSSAAEYLTFVAATGNAQSSVEMRYEDENLWLTQTNARCSSANGPTRSSRITQFKAGSWMGSA